MSARIEKSVRGPHGARKGDRRYRLYFRLMDACLLFLFVGLIDQTAEWVGLHDAWGGLHDKHGSHPAWYVALGAVTLIFNFLVAPFLILASFMRDEYAQQLWQRTVGLLVKVVTFFPMIVLTFGIVTQLATGSRRLPAILAPLLETATWVTAMTIGWLVFCLLFVVIFQFLRWWDSR